MTKEISTIDRIDTMDRVAKLWLTGNRNPTRIAKELGLRRADVLEYIEDYKAIARNDEEVKNRSREALFEADASLNMVIEELWRIVNEDTDNKIRNVALKNIADVDFRRVETLQKAGLYDDAALGDQIAEQEEKIEILKGILRDVSLHCDNCKFEVARRLRKVTGQAEPVPDQPKIIDVEVTAKTQTEWD